MLSVHRLLRRAALWFHVRLWLNALAVALTAAAGAMALTRIFERLLGFPVAWSEAWVVALSGALVGSILWTVFTRRTRIEVARVLDDRASLRETLSTALCVEQFDDPWSRAAVLQAESVAQSVRLLRALPAPGARRWGAPLAVTALFFLAGLAPQFDLLRLVERAQATQKRAQELVDAKVEAFEAEKFVKDALASVDDPALKDLESGEGEAKTPEPSTPQEIRLEAIRKLTTMQDRLASLREGDKSQALDELRKKMLELKAPRGPELSDLAQALQKGDFEGAKKTLDELARKLAEGGLSEEQKKALAEQMKSLAEQLDALAKDRKELENKLREAGLDPKLAANPDALKKALEQMEGLSSEQKQALSRLAQASAKACESCRSLGGSMSRAAQRMQGGDPGAMGELGGELSALEMMEQDFASLNAASKAVKNRLAGLVQGVGTCSGDELCFSKNAKGGGLGIGPRDSAPTGIDASKKIKVKGRTTDGPIIGTTLVQGDQVVGQAAQQFADAVHAGQASAAEAIESNRIPKELEDAVKRYFGRLEKQIPAGGGAPADPEGKPASAAAPSAAAPSAAPPSAAPAKEPPADKPAQGG